MRLKDENCKNISDKSNLELFTKLLILEIAVFNMAAVVFSSTGIPSSEFELLREAANSLARKPKTIGRHQMSGHGE